MTCTKQNIIFFTSVAIVLFFAIVFNGCTQKINGFYTKCIEVKEGVYYEYIISKSSMELLNKECVR